MNTLAAITDSKAGFRSLGDAWADTTTPHGRLMLTVLGGLAEFERELIRARTSEGRARAVARGVKLGRQAEADAAPEEGGDQAPRPRRGHVAGNRPQLQRSPQYDFEAVAVNHIGELDLDTMIWRYLTLKKFVSLIELGAVWLAKLGILRTPRRA